MATEKGHRCDARSGEQIVLEVGPEMRLEVKATEIGPQRWGP